MKVPMRRSDIERKNFLELAKKAASVIARGAFLGKTDREQFKKFLRQAPHALKRSTSCSPSSFAHETRERFGSPNIKMLIDNLRGFPEFNRELGVTFIEWMIRSYGFEADAHHFYFLCTRPDLPARKRPLIWHLGEAYRRNG